MRVIGYCRVSTGKQAEKGVSLDAQEEKIRQYCDLYDHKLIDIVIDPGESAKSLDREGIQQVLNRLKSGEADGLLVYKLDRLTRSMFDLAELLQKYFNNGIALLSVCEQIDTKTAMGRNMIKMIILMSEWERETIAERTSAALQHKIAQGVKLGGSAAYGYRLVNKELIEDENEQAIVELIKTWHETGLSLRKIASQLSEQGFVNRRGRPFNAQTIKNILDHQKQLLTDELKRSVKEYLS